MQREIQKTERASSRTVRTLRTVVVAVLAILGMTVPGAVGVAFAADALTVTQSKSIVDNGNVIDLTSTTTNTDEITINLNAQSGDVLVVKIDPKLWSSVTWPTASEFSPYGTVAFDSTTGTATFAFSAITTPTSFNYTVPLTPTIDNSEVLSPRDASSVLTPGNYSLDATVTHTDSTTETDSADFSLTDGYNTGSSWTDVVFTNEAEGEDYTASVTYAQNTDYTFSIDNSLRVSYDSSVSGDHLNWDPKITRMTISMPADFVLDAASSPGWTQNADGTITYDPTATGATTSFTGQFTADPSATAYTATGTSTASGYFGTSTDLTTITLQTPVVAKIVAADSGTATAPGSPSTSTPPTSQPAAVTMVPWSSKGIDVYVPSDSTAARSNMMPTTYSIAYGAIVWNNDMTNMDYYETAPDGSLITGGYAGITNPVEGQTYVATFTALDGTTETVTHVVTAAEAAKKGDYTLHIDAPTDGNTWSKVELTNSGPVSPNGSSNAVWYLNYAVQKTYADGTAIKEGDVRYAAACISGDDATTGKQTAVTGYGNCSWSHAGATPSVTYHTALQNSDLGMGIDSDSSNVKSTFSKSLTYRDTTTYTEAPQMNASSSGTLTGASETTAYTINEPIFYVMLPRKTTLVGTPSAATTDSSGNAVPAPTVTTYTTSSGQTVVKYDWTGTGWAYNTRTDSSVASGILKVQFEADNNYGITTTSPAAIWVSNVNDSGLTVKASSVNGTSTSIPIDSTTSAEATESDANAVLIGSMNVTVVKSLISSGISSKTTIIDNASSTPSDTAINALTTTHGADHKLSIDITNLQTSSDTAVVRQLVNLPTSGVDVRLSGPITLNKTDGTTTAVATDATVLYSTTTQTAPTGNDPAAVDETGYVTADKVTDWSKITSFIVDIPASASNTEYYATISVTDASAATQTDTWAQIQSTFYATNWASTSTTLYDSYVKLYGTKTWVDNNDEHGLRPDSITVNLLNADGSTADTATGTASNDWQYSFDKTAAAAAASESTATHTAADFTAYEGYTVSEDPVHSYLSKVDGLDVTNTYIQLLTSLPFTGGTGYSYSLLAIVIGSVSIVTCGAAVMEHKRMNSKRV